MMKDITALITDRWLGAVRCFGLNWPVSYAWTLNISRYTRITEIVGAASERPKYVIETKGTGPVISLGGWTEVG
jgi:hypothetical protein